MEYMTMVHTHSAVPDTEALLRVWLPFKKMVGATSVRTEADYAQVSATVSALLEQIDDNESHPLAELLDYLANQMKVYEDEHCPIPEAEPCEVLRLLMEQHNLKQEDLTDCAPQGRISDYLSGKRPISRIAAKSFARRFRVHADLFL
jgi:HTH-type transcriptional regulator / antitoxin HigA